MLITFAKVEDGSTAADRSGRLLAANRTTLGIAEVMAGVVHDAVEYDKAGTALADARRVWGVFSTDEFPWTPARLTAAIDRLARLAADYDRDGLVHVDWPDELTSPVPDRPERRRGRS